jgi:hypothetical protein
MRSLALLLLAVGCSGANPSSGQTAAMRVQGAQYLAGSIHLETIASVPAVHSINIQNPDLFPGVTNKSITGTVGPGSTAILIGLLGDVGHWVIPVQDLDTNSPGDLTFSCSAAFPSMNLVGDGGSLSLVVRATDENGEIGPAYVQPIVMEAIRPQGSLVISLDWDTQADLDLHVVLPSQDGGLNEIWSRKPSGLPLGQPGATVDEGKAAGYLDRDSNSQCAIDGNRIENVIFPGEIPGGQYIVRVDAFSLCGEMTARWRVRIFDQETTNPTLQAFGQSSETDTRYPHGQGAGVQALVFDFNP